MLFPSSSYFGSWSLFQADGSRNFGGGTRDRDPRDERMITMKDFKLLNIKLNLFEGGAAAGGDGAGSGDGGAMGGTQAVPGRTRRGKTGETVQVRYGKQPAAETQPEQTPAAGETKVDNPVTSNSREDKRKAYQDLINGEYKEFYTEDTQKMINRRFKETKGLQEQVAQYQPVIDMLSKRYKVEDGDLSKILSAMEADDTYWDARAEELGMTRDGAKQYDKAMMENQRLKAVQQRQQGEARAQEQLTKWYQEAEAMKGSYPDFDLAAESENPRFLSMLQSGVPVQTAYEVIHLDDIKAASARTAAQAREKQVVEGIKARGQRPAENGASSQAAFVVKDDVSKLSRKDRADIARRSAMGEKIVF